MRKLLFALVLLAAAAFAVFWWLSAPQSLTASESPQGAGDPVRGETVFYAAGCASCHAAPGAKGEDKLKLAGGLPLKTPFGTFYAPNISSDPSDGIGAWSDADFANAVLRGVAPDGRHYYPAFPYLSYQRMTLADVQDMKAFMETLPAVKGRAPDHDLPLPLKFRRGIGLWKWLYMDLAPFAPPPGADAQVARGAYLVTGPGHCGECHTPRNVLGAPDGAWAFAGAPDPEGDGYVPNITPHADGIGDWSVKDIASALKTGILPDFETFGGSMTPVQENMAKLSAEDREAIGAFLKSLPPKESRWKKQQAAGQ